MLLSVCSISQVAGLVPSPHWEYSHWIRQFRRNVDRIVNSAFRGILETVDGYTILPGVVSRKKQMVPPIIDAIQREDHS